MDFCLAVSVSINHKVTLKLITKILNHPLEPESFLTLCKAFVIGEDSPSIRR